MMGQVIDVHCGQQRERACSGSSREKDWNKAGCALQACGAHRVSLVEVQACPHGAEAQSLRGRRCCGHIALGWDRHADITGVGTGHNVRIGAQQRE